MRPNCWLALWAFCKTHWMRRIPKTLEKYLKGVGADAAQRSRLFRLAWDFAATALGSRNEQYERFYLGSVGRNLAVAHSSADRARANRLVDRFLLEALDEPAAGQASMAAS